eukprot:COSAG02_NODE_64_length_43111_cov_35.627709_7_plen_60_part_00
MRRAFVSELHQGLWLWIRVQELSLEIVPTRLRQPLQEEVDLQVHPSLQLTVPRIFALSC